MKSESAAKRNILVLTTGYPSKENPYSCAFVHTRVREYMRRGLDVTVCHWDPRLEDDSHYEYEGVKVHVCSIKGVRDTIDELGPFSLIVAHFADVPVLNILERESHRSRIVIVLHGGDILGARYFCHAGRPYFEFEEDENLYHEMTLQKREMYRRLSENGSVHWIFVSEALKSAAEDFHGFKFSRNVYVIRNWIDESRFRFRKKTAEHRKKIYFCRRFDNEKVYCVDTVMLAVRRLAEREFFKDLEFHMYGDGGDYDRLVAPVLEFDNVKLHRHFTDNAKLPELLDDFGIGLFPSRYDSDPVAIREAAQSGLVCIGGDIPSLRDIFPQAEFGTLIDPDSPEELASLIEKLYGNADMFLDLSERMSRHVMEMSSKGKTIDAECDLVRRLSEADKAPSSGARGGGDKALSVIVPAYNMEKYLDVCIDSLVCHDKANELEVLVVNDGSNDSTLAIANKWADRFPRTVKVLDKANGGHGSCINAAMAVATGRYVRIVDADDWVISSNLARQIEKLEKETADCVLTYGQYDYVESGLTEPIFQYPNLIDGASRTFDDVQFAGYGFKGYGPMLPTSSWRRSVLLDAKVRIMEGVPYADILWNIEPVACANNFVLYDLDIYRYLKGRPGQSVSLEVARRRWKDHDNVFHEAARFALEDKRLTSAKRKYVIHNVLAEFGVNNIYLLHLARGLPEVEAFLLQFQEEGRDALLGEIIRFARKQEGTTLNILRSSSIGKQMLRRYGKGGADAGAVRLVKARGSIFHYIMLLIDYLGLKKSTRGAIKGILPYALVRKWQRKVYGI